MLTTLTPYWGRPETLRVFLAALERASYEMTLVHHIICFIGEPVPGGLLDTYRPRFRFVSVVDVPGDKSIGHYHNFMAEMSQTEWIMKLDADAIPHEGYFRLLVPLLDHANPRQWFNGGMFYLSSAASDLLKADYALTREQYMTLVRHTTTFGASNFICRRQDYLDLGGCDSRFRGWGWEDYQQIYMLEKYQRGADPLPGHIGLENVTLRCREEISRDKARQLLVADPQLGLLHYWHKASDNDIYRKHADNNRKVLLDYILTHRK